MLISECYYIYFISLKPAFKIAQVKEKIYSYIKKKVLFVHFELCVERC